MTSASDAKPLELVVGEPSMPIARVSQSDRHVSITT